MKQIIQRISLLVYSIIGSTILYGAVFICSMPAAVAATPSISSPKPGNYCPGPDILLVVAEDLTTTLDLTMRSRTALINKDLPKMIGELTSAKTALYLAASRGAAARTILLIDAIIQSKTSEDYAQVLTWFPLLQTSMLTLPNDATTSAADDLIGNAEDIMQGDKNGNVMSPLKKARHMLACDNLDIQLHAAMQTLDTLMSHPDQNTKISAYDTLLDSLRGALDYTMKNSEI